MLKCNDYKWEYLPLDKLEKLGTNILSGKLPEIVSFGEEKTKFNRNRVTSEELLYTLTDDNDIKTHLDFENTPFGLTYDIGKITDADTVCISGYHGGGKFVINDFELYASEEKDLLYSPESLVYKCYHTEDEDFFETIYTGKANHLFYVSGTLRYIGVKILTPCVVDEFARISRVAVFNDYYNARCNYCYNKTVADSFKGLVPEIIGDCSGNAENLTNGRAFFDDETVTAIGDITIKFTNTKKLNVSKLSVVGKDVNVKSIIADGKKVNFTQTATETYDGRKIYEITFDDLRVTEFSLDVSCGAVIDTLYGDSSIRSATVDVHNVTEPDFMGGCANVIPTHFCKMGLDEGYNDVYFELEKHHIEKAKPHCVRMWFQIDWMVSTKEQYENGDWEFDTVEMDSVKRFCKAYRDEGVEIEFNFGWKIGRKIWDWFCINGLTGPDSKRNSAPADLYNYGKACAAVLEYLILDCGFDNIKYYSFYNEPRNGINSKANTDFNAPGDMLGFYSSMMKYARYFVEHSRVAGMLEMWAAETSFVHSDVMNKINILAHEYYERQCIHRYELTYYEMQKFYENEILPYRDGKPIMLTECGNSMRTRISWDKNHINLLMLSAKMGICGAFIWILQGAPLIDPLNWMHSGPDCDSSYTCWPFLPIMETLENVGESAYEWSLPNNYIPNHSKAYMASADYNYSDIRLNAFYKDGEYTLCVESKGDNETDLVVDLGMNIGRKFYRHTYRHGTQCEGNIIIPAVDKVLDADNKISDHIGKGYSFTVYTTIKPVRQVIMDKVDIRLKAGEHYKLSATVLDNDSELQPVFSVSASLCDGAKYENGEVIVPDNAKSGDMFAVKAALPTGEYGISIVRVVS